MMVFEERTSRTDIVTDEQLEYLDDLRESGIVNMFGASPYVRDEFDLTKKEAREVLSYWMKTFGKEAR